MSMEFPLRVDLWAGGQLSAGLSDLSWRCTYTPWNVIYYRSKDIEPKKATQITDYFPVRRSDRRCKTDLEVSNILMHLQIEQDI